MNVEGNTNDYFGKGLSGATLSVRKPLAATFKSNENVIIGNVALYGATSGEAYINGIGGERFCVRNSGAKAVIEGVGDHGCEYMTGGVAVILGRVGRNFGAGMSGGTAYIYNFGRKISTTNFNMEMIGLEEPTKEDKSKLKSLVEQHLHYTQSELAQEILENWEVNAGNFVKVMPVEYKKALLRLEEEKKIKEEEELKTA